MSTKKVKRKIMRVTKDPTLLIPLIVIIATLIFIILFQTPTNSTPTGQTILETTAKYEITETDIFSISDIKGKDISVKGVMLGDSKDEVIEKIGKPDSEVKTKLNRVNLEYGNGIGLSESGIIIQIRENKVRKITIREPFNEFLKGDTKITHSKNDIYLLVGKPDNTEFVPLSPDSSQAIRVIQYFTKGIEVMTNGKKQIGFAITDAFDVT